MELNKNESSSSVLFNDNTEDDFLSRATLQQKTKPRRIKQSGKKETLIDSIIKEKLLFPNLEKELQELREEMNQLKNLIIEKNKDKEFNSEKN